MEKKSVRPEWKEFVVRAKSLLRKQKKASPHASVQMQLHALHGLTVARFVIFMCNVFNALVS